MEHWICVTCGVQFPASEQPPERCPICTDARQYIGPNGQQWTTLAQMRAQDYQSAYQEHEPGLTGIGTSPSFAIGQRALLVRHPQGNVLWDCMTFFNDATLAEIERLGGVTAMAISHPHYYSTMVEWARHFDMPVYLHEADRKWVMRSDEHLTFWSGDQRPLKDGLTLLRLGGHFAGGTVLHWAQGAEGRGALLSGDIIQVVSDRRWVSFMYSYPNLVPLPAAEVARIQAAIAPWRFERLYGAWFDRVILHDAHDAVQRSADRYIEALRHIAE
ncbi:MAG TPA: MBL fold metallo-hydrolase [Ktedonobacterales bacterium]